MFFWRSEVYFDCIYNLFISFRMHGMSSVACLTFPRQQPKNPVGTLWKYVFKWYSCRRHLLHTKINKPKRIQIHFIEILSLFSFAKICKNFSTVRMSAFFLYFCCCCCKAFHCLLRLDSLPLWRCDHHFYSFSLVFLHFSR